MAQEADEQRTLRWKLTETPTSDCKDKATVVKHIIESHSTNLGAMSEQRSIIHSSKCRWDKTDCSSSDRLLSPALTTDQFEKHSQNATYYYRKKIWHNMHIFNPLSLFKGQRCQLVTFCHPGLTYVFNIWHSGTLALSPELQSAWLSEIKNVGATSMALNSFKM